MSQTAVALLALAALLSTFQWVWMRAVGHVDLRLLDVHSRHRVRWLQANSGHIQLTAAILFAGAGCAQVAALLS